MLAYHNDEKIKAMFVNRVKAHAKADEIIHGKYWENGKGCAFGCMYHSSNHTVSETEAGIPVALSRLQDCIFEGLENRASKKWVVDFPNAIPVGADLSLVQWKFLHWLQKENLAFAKKQKMPADVISAIKQCVDVLAPMTKGKPVDKGAASAARSAARSAAESAAESAARSAAGSAESAARSAAGSAAWSAESAARSAESAAWSAESAAYQKMADKLLEFIKAAPVKSGKGE